MNRFVATALALRMLAGDDFFDDMMPKLPKPKRTYPGYYQHIPKSERKGKSVEELRAMREEKRDG